MDLVTTQCRSYGHPEFLLQAEGPAAEASLVEWSRGLESMVAGGSRFRPGQSFLVGWMLTQVVQHDRDHLTLHEPDMQSMPVRWVPGITQTLQSMMVQKFTLESVGLADRMDLPSAQHYLTVCDGFDGRGFFMARRAGQEPTDSGWFVGCLDPRHNHRDAAITRPVSVYEAYLSQRFIVGFLGFPPGSMIVADPASGVRLTLNNQPLNVLPGSYLDQMLRGS